MADEGQSRCSQDMQPARFVANSRPLAVPLGKCARSFHGFSGAANTGNLTLETIELKNKYKGHFDVKTVDHQKADGVFDVQ